MAPSQDDPKFCAIMREAAPSDQGSPQSSVQDCGNVSSSSRKVHKADREKLRRDKLNEQFVELASVLDPQKPKHDKATILGDSLQIVKELRNEIRRLRMERGSLFDESKELKRERDDLEDEKLSLFKQNKELGHRLQEYIQATLSFASTAPLADQVAAPPQQPIRPQASSVRSQVQVQVQPSLPPYTLYPPSFHFRPQTGAAADNPFVYLTSPSVPHVERPCAQYATADAVPDFLVKVQSSRGFQPLVHRPQATSLEDDSDVELQLGQPRSREQQQQQQIQQQIQHQFQQQEQRSVVQVHEVDTNLQLKVAVDGVAHGRSS